MMTDFYTLSVDEAVTWIRAWTDHTWPITLPQAFAIRDSLGWIPSPQEPRYFTTKLSTNGQEDGIILRSNEYGIKGLTFNLSPLPSPEHNEENLKIARIAYSQYIISLERIWGQRQAKTDSDGVSLVRWTLPNRVSTLISHVNTLISVDINSPWATHITEEYDRMMEDYD